MKRHFRSVPAYGRSAPDVGFPPESCRHPARAILRFVARNGLAHCFCSIQKNRVTSTSEPSAEQQNQASILRVVSDLS